ncbi:hypothetical protein V8C34DRAFT_168339 [Trichoderma compactum]
MMLFTDPIITFLCLYVAVNFGIEFSFFAVVPYVFSTVYHFGVKETGLAFLSIVIGCLLGLITIILCDIFIYQKSISLYPPHKVPPEHRLYPAMIGSIGGPIGLFWFAWTARENISWLAQLLLLSLSPVEISAFLWPHYNILGLHMQVALSPVVLLPTAWPVMDSPLDFYSLQFRCFKIWE